MNRLKTTFTEHNIAMSFAGRQRNWLERQNWKMCNQFLDCNALEGRTTSSAHKIASQRNATPDEMPESVVEFGLNGL
jgi:hypothetical protein